MIKSYQSKGGQLWSREEAEEGTGDRTESSGGSDAESVDEEGDGIPNQGKDDDLC